MTTRRSILVGALGVTLGALPVHPIDAQALIDWSGARQSVESFYTRIAFDAGGHRRTADGIGGRLMWQPWLLSGVPSSLAGRTSLGVWATYTPEDDGDGGPGFSTLALGGAVDVRPLDAPLGRIDPFVSLGAGVLYTRETPGVANVFFPFEPIAFETLAPEPFARRSPAVRTRTAFTLSPGVGARIPLGARTALQADVRDLMAFDGRARHNVALGVGVRIAL